MLGDGVRVNRRLLAAGGYDPQGIVDQVEGVWEALEAIPGEEIPRILAKPSRLKKWVGSKGGTIEPMVLNEGPQRLEVLGTGEIDEAAAG